MGKRWRRCAEKEPVRRFFVAKNQTEEARITMKKIIGLAFAMFILTMGSAYAEEGKSSVQISGFVDVYYSYNLNTPNIRGNGPAAVSNFDSASNATSLNLAEIVFSKAPEGGAGFRVDLDFGPTTDFVHCGAATCPSATAESTFKNIQQAYITWGTPGKLTVDVGKFVTHMGAEVIETKDNWNYSRGILFAGAIPYYHGGVRVNTSLSDTLSVNGFMYNGWNNVFETDNSKTYGLQVGFTGIKAIPVWFNWIGPEEGTGFKERQVSELIVGFNPSDTLSFMLDYNKGEQDKTAGGTTKWSGYAAYAKWSMEPCALAIRYEDVDDDDGFIFGSTDNNGVAFTKNSVQELTLTVEHKVGKDLLTRVEYRRDMADQKIFFDKGTAVDSQDRVTAGFVYMF